MKQRHYKIDPDSFDSREFHKLYGIPSNKRPDEYFIEKDPEGNLYVVFSDELFVPDVPRLDFSNEQNQTLIAAEIEAKIAERMDKNARDQAVVELKAEEEIPDDYEPQTALT